jgi:predicted transcriptional regulator
MKARKIGAGNFRSPSARAKVLLRKTNLSQSEIARKCGITPQTVNRIRDIMAGLYVQKG